MSSLSQRTTTTRRCSCRHKLNWRTFWLQTWLPTLSRTSWRGLVMWTCWSQEWKHRITKLSKSSYSRTVNIIRLSNPCTSIKKLSSLRTIRSSIWARACFCLLESVLTHPWLKPLCQWVTEPCHQPCVWKAIGRDRIIESLVNRLLNPLHQESLLTPNHWQIARDLPSSGTRCISLESTRQSNQRPRLSSYQWLDLQRHHYQHGHSLR